MVLTVGGMTCFQRSYVAHYLIYIALFASLNLITLYNDFRISHQCFDDVFKNFLKQKKSLAIVA